MRYVVDLENEIILTAAKNKSILPFWIKPTLYGYTHTVYNGKQI